MLNELQLMGEELERDVFVLQQISVVKSGQLEETRKKMFKEIAESQIIRNNLDRKMAELEVTRKELEENVKTNEILLEENKKCRDLMAKLQVENDFYTKERQLIIDKSNADDIEISSLKSQVGDLEEKLREHEVHKEFHEKFHVKNRALIDQLSSKMDVLTREQNLLENFVKESSSLITKLTEERDLQSLFVKEANISRIALENELFRLIGVLQEERSMKRTLLKSPTGKEKEQKGNYLEDWKSSQEEMNKKIRFLMKENERLMNEVDQLKIRLDGELEKNALPSPT